MAQTLQVVGKMWDMRDIFHYATYKHARKVRSRHLPTAFRLYGHDEDATLRFVRVLLVMVV